MGLYSLQSCLPCDHRARARDVFLSRPRAIRTPLKGSKRKFLSTVQQKKCNTPARRPPPAGPALPAHNMHTTSPPPAHVLPALDHTRRSAPHPRPCPSPPPLRCIPLCRRRWTSHSDAPVCGLPRLRFHPCPPRHRPVAGRARPAECDATGEARVGTPDLCSQRRPSHTHTYAPDCASGLAQCAEVLLTCGARATGHRAPREGRGSAAC